MLIIEKIEKHLYVTNCLLYHNFFCICMCYKYVEIYYYIITTNINRNITSMYILTVFCSTSNVVMIYFNVIIVNLTNTSFTISIMIEYTATVNSRFASIGNGYKVYYHQLDLPTMIVTGYI